MKPQNLAMIVVGSVIGFFTLAGLSVFVAWKLSPAEAMNHNRNPFVGRRAPLPQMPIQIEQRQIPAVDQVLMPEWNMGGFAAPVAQNKLNEVRGALAGAGNLKVSGPHTHNNLSLFLIHGPDTMKGKQVHTLHETLNRGQAVVHDTGFMLSVENRSGTDLYLQSGDIVKGGNQDRTLQYDYLIPANSGRIPLAAFCVEAGRSQPRGLEPGGVFGSATDQLPGKNLRLANLYRHSQAGVWQGVSKIQNDLKANLRGSVQSSLSTSSLQLSLENNRLAAAVRNYLQDLSAVLEGKKDVIGAVVAINGRVHSADLYASADLFRNLYPKLLKAGAIEALAEPAGAKADLPTVASVQSWLAETDKEPAHQLTVNNQIHMIRQEGPRNVLFDTCDRNQNNLVIHRCILVK
jgi:hypothetical protein